METNPRSSVPAVPASVRPPRRNRGWLLALTLVLIGGLATAAVGAVRMFSAGATREPLIPQ
jgi:hypothetical protein